ncbi:carbamoyltransferase HypF [methane-oxidizing endosymbiont of Gigantopelta aegis]|uniref:carbamoyltransferase HypF n=1 Tax=methane-oxidizing endosymbiont of Gigantopelta aegis TaxID=2794938 RepID=UPI0018DC66CA|nr:carbamoyltransferase HypF [methane-oxidizing endosymbiont of Gigantopelta aegis]
MSHLTEQPLASLRLHVRGVVQGVGFRPFVWRLADQYRLAGRVMNDGSGVLIDVWGESCRVEDFIRAVWEQCPPLARIDSIQQEPLPAPFGDSFEIVASQQGAMQTVVPADAAICKDCLDEINDPINRRYRYALTNCTHCGPRLSIIDSIPYDRRHTSMAHFKQCSVCQTEYDNPADRRFHAQPNACPVCGPKLWLEPEADSIPAIDDVDRAAQLIRQGFILAIKGIGGFHLACDVLNEQAVARLRHHKQRDAKPFALMAKSIEIIRQYCLVSEYEADLLASPQAPIVLLEKHPKTDHLLASQIAPEQSVLGFMLPYTPLHALLMQDMTAPLVMTSANLSNQPQCIDNDEVQRQLTGLVDYFLLHDRQVLHRVDDSVVKVVNGQCRMIRRARGYAPQSLLLPEGFEQGPDLLAMGGELKNTFCLIKDGQAVLSQHMGDLEDARVLKDYEHNLKLYQRLFNHQPEILAVDAHPDYLSTKLGMQKAAELGIEGVNIQHHHAHIAACLADNDWPLYAGKVLGIVLDGIGYGQDGELWGGEFLLADYCDFVRLATLRPTALIGGVQAMREPWRNTYAHLRAAFDWVELTKYYSGLELIQFLQQKPLTTIDVMLAKNINTPKASSAGRLFDAVAAALGLCREQISYEGQAAMALENQVSDVLLSREEGRGYVFLIDRQNEPPCLVADNMWRALLNDLQAGTPVDVIATRFHLGLAQGLAEMVMSLQTKEMAWEAIALSGGVLQNRRLFQLLEKNLQEVGFNVLSHRRVPANDGGLAFGQAMVALARSIKGKTKCV